MPYVHGADCELGYGFDNESGFILPFKCEPLGFINYVKKNYWTSAVGLDCNSIQPLNPNYLNVLENRLNIEGDEDDYLEFSIYKLNGYEECKDVDKYPEKTASYISFRTYGLSVNIVMKKHGLFQDRKETSSYLIDVIQKRYLLLKEQEVLTCYVVINGRESHKWTLKELVDFCKKHGNDEKYEDALSVNEKDIEGKTGLRIEYKDKLMKFLKYLYLCYRKIEIAFEKEKSFKSYEFEYTGTYITRIDMEGLLYDVKDKYKITPKRSDIATYIMLKKMFHTYKLYLGFCIRRREDFKETFNVEADVEELQDFWKKLVSSPIVLKPNAQREYEEEEILLSLECLDTHFALKSLQNCIKNIEFKMDRAGCPKLEKNDTSSTKDVKSVILELQKSIEEYQKMPRTSFLSMYPTLKKLYWSYLEYLKVYSRYNIPIDQQFPCADIELMSWSDKMRSWNLRKVGNEWCGSDETLFFINENDADLDPLLKKMKEKEKFKVVSATNLDNDERFIIKHFDKEGNIGLFQLKTSLSNENCDENNVYESKCPSEECPDVQRKWMCTDCCELLKIKNVSCGCQDYKLNQLYFICPSKKHPRVTEEEHDESSVSDVSSKDEKIKELTMKLKEAELENIKIKQVLENIVQSHD